MAASMADAARILEDYPDFPYRDEFAQIIELLHDTSRVDEYLAALREKVSTRAVIVESRRTAGKLLSDDIAKEQILGIALHDVLCEAEKTHGFAKDVWYLGGVLSEPDFFQMMEERIPFMDPLVNKRHGAQTHRMQWWMVCKEMDSGRGALGQCQKNASELYAATAYASAQKATGASSATTLWYRTFDNIQGGSDPGKTTGRCPEWLCSHIKKNYTTVLWPAELVAQAWDTAPLGTSEFLITANNITKMTGKTQVKKMAF